MKATVPGRLVHRAAVAETLITGRRRVGADRFALSVQWPHVHPVYVYVSPGRTAYEPLLVAETVRRCGALLAHAEYGVPLDGRFVLHGLRVAVPRPGHLAVEAAPALPAAPVVGVTVTPRRHRGGRPDALTCAADVRLGGERVATVHLDVSWTRESVYRRLRGGRTAGAVPVAPLPPALPPAAVGRALPADVALAPPGPAGRLRLRVDTAHPVFFDHPLDHVPGMLLLEAAGQAARVCTAGRRSPVSFHASFRRYAELDRPVRVEVCDDGRTVLQVRALQGESTVFECAVEVAEP
ncbi:ScbA/BarX family gamma-butyrolactone biosynthesis protein [Streptomyces sp. NPDC000987]|uniref:ScbA/BarX family gamma-butyrolactone biosynthesis protein n=1 Tax=Streptomyces sp. NPDC000987 TaxID=3154374 RepID=UPI00332011BB